MQDLTKCRVGSCSATAEPPTAPWRPSPLEKSPCLSPTRSKTIWAPCWPQMLSWMKKVRPATVPASTCLSTPALWGWGITHSWPLRTMSAGQPARAWTSKWSASRLLHSALTPFVPGKMPSFLATSTSLCSPCQKARCLPPLRFGATAARTWSPTPTSAPSMASCFPKRSR